MRSATSVPSKPRFGSSWTSMSRSRGKALSSSSIAVPSAADTADGISKSRSRIGMSGPSISPAAIRNSAA